MSDPFVPFFSGPQRETGGESTFDVLVIPQNREESQLASPLNTPLELGSTAAAPALCPTPHARGCPEGAPHAEPEITLDREGDRIVRITVRCSCGQVLELSCTY